MDELSPWNETTSFRLDEVACLIVGRQPLSNRRNPDREDLPAAAIPVLIRLSAAYLGWLLHRDPPEMPEWPKKEQLHGMPNFDGSQKTFLQVVGDKPSRDFRRICWEQVARPEVARWLLAVQMPSEFDFSPHPCDQAAPSKPVHVSADSADDGPEARQRSDLAQPVPLTTGEVAHCFDGLRRWDETAWKKALGKKPVWLQACVRIPGSRGVLETRWDPVLIGAALVRKGHAAPRSVRAKFQSKPLLEPWTETWKTYEADNFDND